MSDPLEARRAAGEISDAQLERAHQIGSPLATQSLGLETPPEGEQRIESSQDFREADPKAFEEASARFLSRFANLAAELQEILGPPDFATGDLGGADPCVVTTFAEELYWRGI